MNCSACGAPIPGGAISCPSCGRAVAVSSTPNSVEGTLRDAVQEGKKLAREAVREAKPFVRKAAQVTRSAIKEAVQAAKDVAHDIEGRPAAGTSSPPGAVKRPPAADKDTKES